MKEEKTIWSRE